MGIASATYSTPVKSTNDLSLQSARATWSPRPLTPAPVPVTSLVTFLANAVGQRNHNNRACRSKQVASSPHPHHAAHPRRMERRSATRREGVVKEMGKRGGRDKVYTAKRREWRRQGGRVHLISAAASFLSEISTSRMCCRVALA